ncbi:MAG: molybdenum cofactor guanylyltransferase [Gammaproteobacteria bacterium]|nr:molybdenum cofactor guanylyltransferase [Gammaproteobacteria bacterium]
MINKQSTIILSGGLGSRLGYVEKGLLEIQGEQLIQRKINQLKPQFEQVILVTNKPDLYEHLADVLLVQDEKKHQGPLFGLYAGLKASPNTINFVSAVDMPYFIPQLVDYFAKFSKDYQTVVAKINNTIQPLFGFYAKSSLEKIAEMLEDSKGKKSVTAVSENTKAKVISETEVRKIDPDLKSFININTEEDLATFSCHPCESRDPGL